MSLALVPHRGGVFYASSFKCDRQMTITTRMRQFRVANHMTEGLRVRARFMSGAGFFVPAGYSMRYSSAACSFIRMIILLYRHGTAMSWAYNVVRGKQLEQD